MVIIPVHCAYCRSLRVIKAGKQPNGAQRYRCKNLTCARTIFLLTYADKGRQLKVKEQMIEMALIREKLHPFYPRDTAGDGTLSQTPERI